MIIIQNRFEWCAKFGSNLIFNNSNIVIFIICHCDFSLAFFIEFWHYNCNSPMQVETVYIYVKIKCLYFGSDYQFCIKLRHVQLNFESEKLFTLVSIPTVLYIHTYVHSFSISSLVHSIQHFLRKHAYRSGWRTRLARILLFPVKGFLECMTVRLSSSSMSPCCQGMDTARSSMRDAAASTASNIQAHTGIEIN